MAEPKIVRCAVHPALGIARVGNAPADQFYLAPEVPGRPADPAPGRFKNAEGQVRKEAARFRIYGYDAEGNVVKEITADDAEITWQVHLANRKAAWYKFANAMDLKQYALSTTFRNGTITGALRDELVIDPGPVEIAGRETSGAAYRCDQGYIRFGDGGPINVPLGELRTDEAGRLIVLGGDGTSASASGELAITFANNEGWYDDVSDGPVRATVVLAGQEEAIEVEPAFVAVVPPNFGQGLYGVVRLYDVIDDLYIRHGWSKPIEEVVFWRDIQPIFERMVHGQWVNQGAYFLYGPGSPGDLLRPERLARLADPGEEARADREAVFRLFRRPPQPWDEPGQRAELPPPQPALLTAFYGDGFGEYANIAIDELALTETQFGWLESWAAGEFIPGEPCTPPAKLEDLPLSEQPLALDQTPLQDCLGGPFHPGIELTWPMRVPRMWHPPEEVGGLLYRLRILPAGETPQDDFGAVLTPSVCVGPEGPLTASGPGCLTRWLGIPWQTDEASCLSGYDASAYLPLPSFWAARVPNEVLSHNAFEQANDPKLSPAQRFKHLAHRQFWLRDLQGSSYQNRINNMVAEWSKIGIVAERKAPAADSPDMPQRWWVETQRDPAFSAADPTWRQLLLVEGSEPRTQRMKLAALSVDELETVLDEKPETVIHPRRRNLRQDSR